VRSGTIANRSLRNLFGSGRLRYDGAVLVSVRQLVDRLRHPRTRADDLAALRARFAAQPSRREATPAEIASAERLRALRSQLADAFGHVQACSGCARGQSEPHGHWTGGHCCGCPTGNVFTPDEVAALKLAGTRMRDLDPPAGDHAGCAFRGPTGCSLGPADRPSICVRYVCLELRAELKEREDWKEVSRLAAELRDEHARFVALRE
jgi:hypothetical protein